jgi:hypothetical protein
MDIERRRANRLRVMRAIFDMSGGSEDQEVLGQELTAQVELTPQELGDACHYLAGEGLIEEAMPDMGASPVPYWINITHQGIREIEESLQAPTEPTEHFPPVVSVINIQGNVIGSPIQSGSPGAKQDVSLEISLGNIRDFLSQLEQTAPTLELPAEASQELAAEIATLRAQVDSPKPKRHIIRESLQSVRAILEGAGGNMTAAGLPVRPASDRRATWLG